MPPIFQRGGDMEEAKAMSMLKKNSYLLDEEWLKGVIEQDLPLLPVDPEFLLALAQTLARRGGTA